MQAFILAGVSPDREYEGQLDDLCILLADNHAEASQLIGGEYRENEGAWEVKIPFFRLRRGKSVTYFCEKRTYWYFTIPGTNSEVWQELVEGETFTLYLYELPVLGKDDGLLPGRFAQNV